MKLPLILTAIALLALLPGIASAQSVTDAQLSKCAGISDKFGRLNCFDSLTKGMAGGGGGMSRAQLVEKMCKTHRRCRTKGNAHLSNHPNDNILYVIMGSCSVVFRKKEDCTSFGLELLQQLSDKDVEIGNTTGKTPAEIKAVAKRIIQNCLARTYHCYDDKIEALFR